MLLDITQFYCLDMVIRKVPYNNDITDILKDQRLLQDDLVEHNYIL